MSIDVPDREVAAASAGAEITVVVALGGNALLRRGEPLEAANQAQAARAAAQRLGGIAQRHRLVVTHGNGPQVGLLSLMGESYSEV